MYNRCGAQAAWEMRAEVELVMLSGSSERVPPFVYSSFILRIFPIAMVFPSSLSVNRPSAW
jgi:hypothetical protein